MRAAPALGVFTGAQTQTLIVRGMVDNICTINICKLFVRSENPNVPSGRRWVGVVGFVLSADDGVP